MKHACKRCLLPLLVLCCLFLSGCNGGREIEEYLFPIMLGLDAAGDGQILLTVKALAGNQESPGAEDAEEQGGNTGYITLSATGHDYMQALLLLNATTPRTLNLSQLSEVIVSQTLARSQAFAPLLDDLLRYYQANGNATLLICAGRAEDVIQKQQAYVGTRISRYLEILLSQYQEKGMIPHSTLLSVTRTLRDGASSPAAVYIAVNDYDAVMPAPPEEPLNVLPGHLNHQSPNPVEYLGGAVFSNGQMAGALTGAQVQMLRMLTDDYDSMQYSVDEAEYVLRRIRPTCKKVIPREGGDVLYARLCLQAYEMDGSPVAQREALADGIAQDARALLQTLQSLGSDAAGFGRTQIVRHLTMEGWEAENWLSRYPACDVQVDVQLFAPQ